MRLEQLTPGAQVHGFGPGAPVTIVAVERVGLRSVTVTFRTADGRVDQVSIHRDDEHRYSLAAKSSAWGMSGDGATFRLAAEAKRIRLAHLFDPLLAVHLSGVRPLPHQIEAVYGNMLPRVPMRFALCDDPGAGKTIMAGLYIKELLLRGDLERCLVVAPGSLATQWQDELFEKFAMQFDIVTRDAVEASYNGNPFLSGKQLLIARLDQLARHPILVERACQVDWDVVVFDEAHRLAAHVGLGGDVKYTKRYHVGRQLGASTRNLLLMTATPHAGKHDDFQLWMALLDSDRFEGRTRDGAHVADVSDLMRRMVKEKLLTFEGKRLFPERRAYTVEYPLSAVEQSLYEAVTTYVRDEMGRADARSDESGNGSRRSSVGFALTSLQRRLASSPEAIKVSLSRRRRRLQVRADEIRSGGRGRPIDELIRQAESLLAGVNEDDPGALDELSADDEESLDVLAESSTAAETLAELEYEIATLTRLEEVATQIRASGVDRKWQELATLIQGNPEMQTRDGSRRKLIIFTEYKDTLHYLVERLSNLIGEPGAVVAIHGGILREERRAIQERFTNDASCEVLVATDAAGEGINLQRSHLMVNFDLPWNPNRLEQRFGRIHRIGQTEVCHLWNLVAAQTREGAVYLTLLNKLEEQRVALGDQVFDVLGQAFQSTPLRDLLIDAIRYGDLPESRARINEVIDVQVGERLVELIELNALDATVMDLATVESVRLQMEEAEAKRLQPHYIQSFWEEAFKETGGRSTEREPGRYEVTKVPVDLRHRDRIEGHGAPLLQNYERICFDPVSVHLKGSSLAALVGPGHPLLDTVVDSVLERHEPVLQAGAMLIDDQDPGTELRLLIGFEHKVVNAIVEKSGHRRIVSRRFEFVMLDAGDSAHPAGPAPYLDFRPATQAEHSAVAPLADRLGDRDAIETRALAVIVDESAHIHLAETRARVEPRIEKMKSEVYRRLTDEAAHWDHRSRQLQLQADAGRQPKMNPMQAANRSDELLARRDRRLSELEAEGMLSSQPPLASAIALVVPRGLLDRVAGASAVDVASAAEARAQVERRAVNAVLAFEQQLGRQPQEQPHNNPGFDIKSVTADRHLLLIEVKGRIAGAEAVTVTRNEILTGLNSERFVLALVEVSPSAPENDVVRYLRHPFEGSDHIYFDVTSVNFTWDRLWGRATVPS